MTERKCLLCGAVHRKATMRPHEGEFGTYYFCSDCVGDIDE